MAYWRLFYHLVWATKGREELITEAVEGRLYPYLVSKAGEMGMAVLAINGWTEHVHMVVAIPPKLSVAEVMKTLKGASSHDLNHLSSALDVRTPHFAWQQGYGALTVGERHCPIAVDYVLRQKEHHANHALIHPLEACEDGEDGVALTDAQEHVIVPRLAEGKASYGVNVDAWDEDVPF